MQGVRGLMAMLSGASAFPALRSAAGFELLSLRTFVSAGAQPTLSHLGHPLGPGTSKSDIGEPSHSLSPQAGKETGLCHIQKRWMAVPKHKVSPHRRGMRNIHRRLRPITNLAQCRRCGMVMMPHQIPHYFCEDEDCPSKYKGRPGERK